MSDSFDDLLFPRGEQGPLVPYVNQGGSEEEPADPYIASAPRTPVNPPLTNYGELFAVMHDEGEARAKQALTGALDLWIAAPAAMVSTTVLEQMQTEAEQNPITRQMAAESNDWIINLATTSHVDWKAFGVGVAAWALVSAAGRMRANFRYPIDRDKTLRAIAVSDGFSPHTLPERRRQRLGQRVVRGTGAVIAGVAAYKLGEQQSSMTDMWLAFGLMGTAATTVTVSEIRAHRHKRRQQRASGDPRLPQIEP